MPTAPGSDVVPLRKETKRRLARLKGEGTYDDVIRDLLSAADADGLAAARALRQDTAPAPAPSPDRDPEEQLLVARLAAERWRLWRRSGRARDLGPRLVEWRPEEGDREVTYVVSRRRGFSP